MYRLGKVKIEWSSHFAYAIGLITTDGNLSTDDRHINLTSKDLEIIKNFKKSLGLKNKIGRKGRGDKSGKKNYFVIQFGDKNFYEFLLSLGLKKAKSKILGNLKIPSKYFSHFLRGCIDGDGTIGWSSHPESRHLQLRTRLYSASPEFLQWTKKEIFNNFGIYTGWIDKNGEAGLYRLNYAKNDSVKLLRHIYDKKEQYYLKRKFEKIVPFLSI